MYTRPPSRIIWLLLTMLVLLAACGGDKDQAASDGSEQKAGKESPGLCSLTSPEGVAAALGGKLPLGPPNKIRNGCEYPILFGEDGNSLSYITRSSDYIDTLRQWEDQGVGFEFIEGLGQEAFIISGAQVSVLLNDTEGFTISIQLISFGEKWPISKEELKTGLIEIATTVTAGLQDSLI